MSKILAEVSGVLAEREGNYDHPLPNFQRIADYWSVLFRDSVQPLIEIVMNGEDIVEVRRLIQEFEFKVTPEQVALAMVLMKTAREQFKHKDDNLVDVIGYVACLEKIVDVRQAESGSFGPGGPGFPEPLDRGNDQGDLEAPGIHGVPFSEIRIEA